MAPIKAEIGGATRLTDEDKATLHAAAGVHLASATQLPFDVGVGWTMDRAEPDTSHGAYVDAAWFVDRTDVSRASIGARAELRDGEERVAAAKLRIETELYKPQAQGNAAAGMFVEFGRAWTTESPNAWVASVGIAFRLPAAFTP